MAGARTRPVTHNGRTTDATPKLSLSSLEFIDNLLDGVTLSAQSPDMMADARMIATARDEIDALLTAAGGAPIRVQRSKEPG